MHPVAVRRAPNCDVEVIHGVIEAFNKIGEHESERSLFSWLSFKPKKEFLEQLR